MITEMDEHDENVQNMQDHDMKTNHDGSEADPSSAIVTALREAQLLLRQQAEELENMRNTHAAAGLRLAAEMKTLHEQNHEALGELKMLRAERAERASRGTPTSARVTADNNPALTLPTRSPGLFTPVASGAMTADTW